MYPYRGYQFSVRCWVMSPSPPSPLFVGVLSDDVVDGTLEATADFQNAAATHAVYPNA